MFTAIPEQENDAKGKTDGERDLCQPSKPMSASLESLIDFSHNC